MKHVLFGVLILCGVSGVSLLAADKPAEKPPVPATQPAKAINKFCAVDKENPVDPTVPTVTYEGKVIGFCCEDCTRNSRKTPRST